MALPVNGADPVFQPIIDEEKESVRVLVHGAEALLRKRGGDTRDQGAGLSCQFGSTTVPCVPTPGGNTLECQCPPPKPCRGRYAQEKEVPLRLVDNATSAILAEVTFDYTALPFWRKPSLEGRFSGRLPTKEDEKRIVEECKLLAPLLGGHNKDGEQSLVTLAKLVRGIAAGDVRRYCEQRERTITVLQDRVAQLEAAAGGMPARCSDDAVAALQAQLDGKDEEIRKMQQTLAAKEVQISAMKQVTDMRPVTIRGAPATQLGLASGLASPGPSSGAPTASGPHLNAGPKSKANKRKPGASPRGNTRAATIAAAAAAATSPVMMTDDCCSTVPEMHTVTTLGSSYVTTGTSTCCCPERHPVLSQSILRTKDEPACPAPCGPVGAPASADTQGLACGVDTGDVSICSRCGDSGHAMMSAHCCEPPAAGSGSVSPSAAELCTPPGVPAVAVASASAAVASATAGGCCGLETSSGAAAGLGVCTPAGLAPCCATGQCTPAGVASGGPSSCDTPTPAARYSRSSSLRDSVGQELVLMPDPVTRHMLMVARQPGVSPPGARPTQHVRHRSMFAAPAAASHPVHSVLSTGEGSVASGAADALSRRSFPLAHNRGHAASASAAAAAAAAANIANARAGAAAALAAYPAPISASASEPLGATAAHLGEHASFGVAASVPAPGSSHHPIAAAAHQGGNPDDLPDLQWLVADLDIIEGMASVT